MTSKYVLNKTSFPSYKISNIAYQKPITYKYSNLQQSL